MNNDILYHYGIKGMKQSVRRFQNKDGTLTPAGKMRYRKERLKRDPNSLATKAVEAGKKSLKINPSNQTKHIKGSHNFDSGKGYVLATLKECEVLISELYGTGESIIIPETGEFNSRERVKVPPKFAIYVDLETKKEYPTRNGMIHYGKKGVHIVPAKPGKSEGSK